MPKTDDSEATIVVRQVTRERTSEGEDRVSVEEPMEIRVGFGPDGSRSARSLSVTMRTPGNDFESRANLLSNDAGDSVTGTGEYKVCAVRIETLDRATA